MALTGVKVLDLATILAAPVAATMLADFGADVVKVEQPGTGDFTRGTPDGARSPHWAQEARNKRSITCNLRTPAGQELVRRLIPSFDVVILNFRPPTLTEWGLDPTSLTAIAPNAVLAYITAYGLTGPYRDRGAFDRIASSFSGLTYVTGEPDADPVRSGYAVIDYMSAYLAAFGIVTALYHRDVNDGTGQVLDLALYEAGFRASEDSLMRHAVDGSVRERDGNRNARIVPATDFDCADGRRVSIHAGTDALFRRFATALGQPQLADDPRFATRFARVEHQEPLYALIADWTKSRDSAEIVTQLSAVNVPSSTVMSIADIRADAHYQERGSIVTVTDEDFGELPMVSPLPRLSATPGVVRHAGPALGAHNAEVYGELLGMTTTDLEQLAGAGVL